MVAMGAGAVFVSSDIVRNLPGFRLLDSLVRA